VQAMSTLALERARLSVLLQHLCDFVNGDRKPDVLCVLYNCQIHPDKLSVEVKKGAAAIARID
jgi:hypothetical protein